MKNPETTCREMEERLPWLLNGTLPRHERTKLREHVQTCAHCKESLRETRLVWATHDQHPPIDVLVRRTLGPLDASDEALVLDHLEECAECREESRLLGQSGEEAGIDLAHRTADPSREGVHPFGDRRRETSGRLAISAVSWRRLSVAASVAATAGLVVSVWSWRRVSSLQEEMSQRRTVLEERILGLENERGRLDAEAKALAEKFSPTDSRPAMSALLNVPVYELLHWQGSERGEEAGSNLLELPAGEGSVALLLPAPPSAADAALGVEIRGDAGELLWSAQGLKLQPTGDCSLLLPTSLIPRGKAAIVLVQIRQGERIRLRTYPLQIR